MKVVKEMTINEVIEKLNELFGNVTKNGEIVQGFVREYKAVKGNRYTKITVQHYGQFGCSAYAFIDNKTGDVFKAATWSAPAKHARGNINAMPDDTTFKMTFGEYSVVYLK